MVAQIHRLSPLQVRVAGHPPVAVGLGQRQQARHQRRDQLRRPDRMRPHVERQVRGHLVVARAPGVELAPHRAGDLGEAPLDRHVDVLVVVADLELASRELAGDRVEPGEQRVALAVVDDPGAVERAHVRARALDVLRPQPQVEADRGVDAGEERVLWLVEAGHRAYVQSPRSASASASQTRSICRSSIAAKNGSASRRAEASSATGNWPSRKPKRSR